MNVITVTHHGVTRVIRDVDLVDAVLARGGVSLYRRLRVQQTGQMREWLRAGHTAAEMLALARVDDRPAHTNRRTA